jgi:hypothetical protein
MNMKRTVFALLSLVLCVALVAGTVLAQESVAGAATVNATASQEEAVGLTLSQMFWEKLAANLGLDKDKLAEVIKQTAREVVEEAAAQGKLTGEQKEKLQARLEQGWLWRLGQGQPNRELPAVLKKLPLEKLAEALGVTMDQLKAELASGKKLVDILKEHGFTVGQLKAKLQGKVPLEKLAEALGMTPDQLRAKLQSGKKLSDVTKEQGLTPELRLKMLEGLPLEKLAEILGLSVDELQSELSSGKKLVDIAKEQGLTVEQFRAKLQEARKQFRAAGKQLGSLPSKKLPFGDVSTQEKEQ